MMTSINIQPSYYNMSQPFYFPDHPVAYPGFMPTPLALQQYSQSSRCADPTTTRPRKRFHVCHVPSCGKRFTTSGNLSRHKRMHGKIDPLKCPVAGCICVFPSTNKLERHLKFHYGGDVKVCHVEACGRTFSTTGNLSRHLKKHHGGVTSPTASVASTTTHTQESGSKVVTPICKSPCSTTNESGSDSDTSSEPWWSSPSEPGTSAAAFDCVWNDELLDVLSVMLDGTIDQMEQEARR